MNEYCLEWIRSIYDGHVVDQSVKLKFIESLMDCLNNGYYLTFSKKGWKLSNKEIEKRLKQQRDMAALVNTLFKQKG